MISFLFIVILSASLLQVGLTLLLGYSENQQRKMEDFNSADITIKLKDTDEDVLEIERYLSSLPEIERYEILRTVSVNAKTESDDATSKNNNDSIDGYYEFAEYTNERNIEQIRLVDKAEGDFDNPLYMTTFAFREFNDKYDLGDSIELVFTKGEKRTFQIAGTYDSMMLDDVLYVSEPQFRELQNEYNNSVIFLIEAADGYKVKDVYDTISDGMYYKHADIDCELVTSDIMVSSDLIMPQIISAILCAFSIIISIVVMVIIYFRIINSIEQNITNIGALKALGCTGSQIRSAQVIEFLITACLGVVLSTIISSLLMKPFGEIISGVTTISWDSELLPITVIGAFIYYLAITWIMSLIATRSIGGLDPVIALRFGLQSHSFKKNHVPLATSSGPFIWLLSLKSAFQNMKQNLMVLIIMCAVGIASAFIVFFGYNICYKSININNLISTVPFHGLVAIREADDDPIADIESIPHVTECFKYSTCAINVEGSNTDLMIFPDCTAVSGISLIEGRVPIYSDEVAYSFTKAKTSDVEVGDYITMSYNGKDKEFVVTGLVQGTDNMGNFAIVNEEGAKLIGIEDISYNIFFLVDEAESNVVYEVMTELESRYGSRLTGYANMVEVLGHNEIVTSALAVTIFITIVSVFIILLTMILLVKTIVIRKQKEFGIQKALGFTSSQIRKQLVLSMVPCIFLGSSVGVVIGFSNSNRLFATLLGSMGLAKCDLPIYGWMFVLAVVCVTLLSMLFMWLLSSKVKRISAYSLITD